MTDPTKEVDALGSASVESLSTGGLSKKRGWTLESRSDRLRDPWWSLLSTSPLFSSSV